MTRTIALSGARIFDGHSYRDGAALLLSDDTISDIVPEDAVPSGFEHVSLDGGLLAPGFIDLQVNGGGGVLFNEQPTVEGISRICEAHARFGTTALLATLITDTPDLTKRAIAAGIEAYARKVPGFLGLHLEGPHLSTEKRGAHRLDLIRPMTDRDVEALCEARRSLPNLMVTVAPEAVADAQIAELARAGICVSLGHTGATAERAKQTFKAGARCVTHLFNAMSGLTHREPGLVGAALSTVGSDQIVFELNGRQIFRRNGRLTLADGTLAGADLDMNAAVRFIAGNTHLPLADALRMASLYPARCLGVERARGHLGRGAVADLVHIDDSATVRSVWIAGVRRAAS